jgi:exo-beta-1,3-glucanase (GH17 family)/cellulose synthase/poly-beta-1,6-N-acetylglucosamine synthase-like glycosyltransferase
MGTAEAAGRCLRTPKMLATRVPELKHMRLSNWMIGLVVAVLFAGTWVLLNRPVEQDPWTQDVSGLTYTPFRDDANPTNGREPTLAEVRQDLSLMASLTSQIRTYSTVGANYGVPTMADKMGLRMMAGAWIDVDPEKNQQEIDNLIALATDNGSVSRITVGNEAIYKNLVKVPQLIEYIREVKRRLPGIPVSTAEPYGVWLDHPELLEEVDFVAVHILPFWNGIPVDDAVDWTLGNLQAVKDALAERGLDKRVVLTEVGWPSQGLQRQGAIASPVNQGIFLRNFVREAKKQDIEYFIIEGFDQPWKAEFEGGVGAYWGVWDGHRSLKPALQGILVNYQNWRVLGGVILVLGLPFVLWVLRAELGLIGRGKFFLALLGQSGVMIAVWVYATYAGRYLTWFDIVALAMIAPATVLLLAIFLIEGVEMAVNLWLGQSLRRRIPPPVRGTWTLPKVSIHVPCYNEPPEMMIETIRALEKLDYARFEVLVIDNNTKDDAVWQPVAAYVASLNRPNFKFFHLPKWPGFKAGALNYALGRTDPEAELVATIDSDYKVRPEWLKELVPYFADPEVALMQAPQDYRDAHEDLFKRMCFWEYAGFFHLGMKTRDEKNAIIQHGTMALIRKSALIEVGGWGEWCITEDAELGLRLFEAGYRAVYTEKSFGKGLMPDSFEAYRKQRYRWAYGAMTILRTHARDLLPFGRRRLNRAQRYQFLAGWMPWIADGLQLLFVYLAIAWSMGMILLPDKIEPPLTLYLIVTLGMFFFKVGKSMWLYASKVPCSFLDNLGAAFAGLSLSYAVSKAVWRGLFTSNLPFHRTPKLENQPAIIRGLVAAREETAIFLMLVLCGAGILWQRGTMEPTSTLWAVLLCVQALPFFAALVMSMINVLPIFKWRRAAAPMPDLSATVLPAGAPAAGELTTGR